MKTVYISSTNILSPLATTSGDNFMKLIEGVSSLKKQVNTNYLPEPFYASIFNDFLLSQNSAYHKAYSKFENLLVGSIADALQKSPVDPKNKKTILIISTTKGNIDLLENNGHNKIGRDSMELTSSAKIVAAHFEFINKPIVISNACISGLLAIITGMRLIKSGQYDTAVIAGADIISKFVLSGFQSFEAISKDNCKPFDADRAGINLGEAAGTIILSASKKKSGENILIAGGAVSNDANHISGPSRTGAELNMAITKAMKEAAVTNTSIDFISAHGTATIFNDEMEANALTLSGLQHIPVNSLKGYYGHTLGASGIVEAIVSVCSLEQNKILPTHGFKKLGVTKPINVCSELLEKPVKNCLKTASGFGGCNAAIIISKQ